MGTLHDIAEDLETGPDLNYDLHALVSHISVQALSGHIIPEETLIRAVEIMLNKYSNQKPKAYQDLEKLAREMARALDFYTKHPIYWDKNEDGSLIEEGPSLVAISALKSFAAWEYI